MAAGVVVRRPVLVARLGSPFAERTVEQWIRIASPRNEASLTTRAIAVRMDRDPAIAARAKAKIRAMLAEGRELHYARLWEALLTGPSERLREVLVADTEEARTLRQSTPFAGAIEPRERWKIWKETRERVAAR